MSRKSQSFPCFLLLSLLILFSSRPADAQSVAASGATSATGAANAPLITQAVDESNLVVLRGNTHPLALPQYDQGAVSPDLALHRMLLVLKRSPAQEAALDQLLDAQQDNSSPSYHQWLTPQQFGQQFGPADQDIQTITTWLGSHGFQVASVSNGRTVIEFSGTASQVADAFHTTIHNYSVNGEHHYANSTDPQIPAALAPAIAGVRSLHNFFPKPFNHSAGTFRRDKDSGKIVPAGPLPIPQFQAGTGCGFLGGPCELLGPYDLGTIYNYLSLWNQTSAIDGTGVTVAIVGETDINPADWTSFWNMFGVTAPKGSLNVIHDGPDPGILQDGEEAESDIDTQWSSAAAKGATIDFVVDEATETTLGVDLAAQYIVDTNLAPVMSESYGACEFFLGTTGNAYYNAIWQQAAAQGISVFLASGDSGSSTCDRGDVGADFGLAVSGFASTPYNVAVGGTDFNDLTTTASYWNPTNNSNEANARGYIPESTWNGTCTNAETFPYIHTSTAEQNCNFLYDNNAPGALVPSAGSGGASACTTSNGQSLSTCSGGYAKPSWQTGTGVPNDTKRDIPDVSLFASNGFNNSAYIICESDVYSCELNNGGYISAYGGTSVSSPAFAGIMALVIQKNGGERQGNPNYVFYKMAAGSGNSCSSSSPTSTCVFYDIPSGSTIAMACVTGSANCSTSTGGDLFGVLTANGQPAYNTGAGFDLATGLGSVNVTNLVNGWSTYAGQFKATKFSAFSLSPTTATHGQSVTVSATVVPQTGTGTPTGTITLIANDNTANQQAAQQVFTLNSSGSLPAGVTTVMLPGGTSESITAHYSGDATFAPSDSSPFTVTVNPEPSKTQLKIVTFSPTTGQVTNSNATSFTYGSPYLLRADVTNNSSALCFSSSSDALVYSCPTGSTTFSDNGNPLGSGPYLLNSQGYTEYQSIELTGGSHVLGGSYSGDSSYQASAGSDSITVTLAPTSSSISSNQGQAIIGGIYTVDVTTQATSSGVPPTANFVVYDGSTPLSTTVISTISYSPVPGSVEILATLQVTISAPSGQHSLTVHYNGDTNYASSISPPLSVTAVYLPTVSETLNPTTVLYPGTVAITAIIATGNPSSNPALKPTGTVTMNAYIAGTSITPVTTTATQDAHGNWVLQATATFSPSQSDYIQIAYSGDSNYAYASAQAYVTVNIPGFTIAANPSAVSIVAGQSGQTTITITPVTNYTSTVMLSCNGLALYGETCSVSPSSVTLSNGATATATVTISILAPSSTTTALSPPVTFPGLLPSLERQQARLLLLAATWWSAFLLFAYASRRQRWHVRYSSCFVAACILCTVASCGGGGYGGGTGGGGGGGGGGGQAGPYSTTTSISTTSSKLSVGGTATLTATVSATDTPTGLVEFDSGGSALFGIINLANGTAQRTLSYPSPYGAGTYAISAQYDGDQNNLGSQSGTLNITFTGSGTQSVIGQTATFSQASIVNVTVQ